MKSQITAESMMREGDGKESLVKRTKLRLIYQVILILHTLVNLVYGHIL